MSDKEKSLIPALLTGAAALWLGWKNKGSLLTDIASSSMEKVIYGEKTNNPKQPQNKNKNRPSRGHKRKVPTSV